MQITTIENHQSSLDHHSKRNVERLDLDVSDSALSSWASDQTIKAENLALDALKLGAEHGNTEPRGYFRKLATLSGEIIDAKLFINPYDNYTWLLSDAAAQKYGRKFIPAGTSSRIQKSPGLQEVEALRQAKRYIISKGGAFLGAPCHYFLIEAV